MFMKSEFFQLESSVEESKKGKPEGFFAPSALHGKRLTDAAELVRGHMTHVKTVLDVGCGYGDMFHLLNDIYPDIEYLGIDPVEWVAEEAVKRLPEQATIAVADLSDLPLEGQPAQYDLVVCLGVLAMIDKEVAPKFVARLYQMAKHGIILEWHDARIYQGKFTSYTPEEMVGLFSAPFTPKNSIKRGEESSITTFLSI